MAEAGYYPLEYYEDLLRFLDRHKSEIEIITYEDFAWGDDHDHERGYPEEWARWQASLSDGTRDPEKIYLVIQHDVDAQPERTNDALRLEASLGIRSNVMLFNRRVNRRHMQATGQLQYDDKYQLDFDLFAELQGQGFVFCYHSNPYEQAGFDPRRAMQVFEEDVRSLRERFNVKYFSPHGGARGPDGKSNNSLGIPTSLQGDIRWVANRCTPRFQASFSDGGPNSPKRDPNTRDLRDFARSWKRGGRYRILTHPQYYHTPCGRSERLAEAQWYRDMLERYATGRSGLWEEVVLLSDSTRDRSRLRRRERGLLGFLKSLRSRH